MSELWFENKCDNCKKKFHKDDDVHVYSRTYIDRISKDGTLVKGNTSYESPVVVENDLVLHCHQCWMEK